MKKVTANTISNIATKLWSLISIYLFIPLYIKILGEAAYGLVSIFSTLQATLNILGIGLSNTLGREFATGETTIENNTKRYKLLKSTELIYFLISFLIIAICFFGSDFIANDWLNIENLDNSLVTRIIFLMGISIAFQLLAHLYSGCLLGMQHQVLSNSYSIAWSALKSIGSLVIIWIVPNLIYFYLWHIFIDIIYVIILRITVAIKCECEEKWHFSDIKNLKSIWRYTLGILVISFVSLINRQMDKFIISKYLSLTEVGAYNIANTLGSLTSIIPSAIYTTIFPKFTYYATTQQEKHLNDEFLKINKFVNIIVICMGTFIAVYSLPLIFVWTGSKIYYSILGNAGALVVLAIMFSELQEIPYALALANGNTKINVFVGIVFLPLVLLGTFFSVYYYGLIGAGAFYLLMMFGQTLLYQLLVSKKYILGQWKKIIFLDTIVPFIASFLIAIITKQIISFITLNALLQSLWGICFGAITLILLLLTYKKKHSGKENK